MAITSISRMQQRRGLRADLPPDLAEGEFGWCLDTRELFIGNGPGYGRNSSILTEHSPNDILITNRFRTYDTQMDASIVRGLGSKLNDIASVKDFGARGDGTQDDAPYINTAIHQLLSSNGVITDSNIATRVTLRLPAGVYRISSPILLYPYVTLIGDGIDRTIILADDASTMDCMLRTADSKGNIDSNIGNGGAILPTRIAVANLTVSTNTRSMNIALAQRYQSMRFESVKFIGGYTLGDGIVGVHAGVHLESIGNGTPTYDAQFVSCEFTNLTYGILADDPVIYTMISQSLLHGLYRAINIGENANYNGPSYINATNTRFYNTEDYAIAVYSLNPGISSSSNSFYNCGPATPIFWDVPSTLNSSIADVFDTIPGILDLGTSNLIADAQQNNLPGGGTVTSVGASGGSTGLTFAGGPVTSSGTLTLGGTLGTNSGGTGLTGLPTNGQLLIGNGTGFTLAALAAGSGVSIVNGSGSITISATGSGTGTVTSVNGSGGTTGLTVNGGPISVSGTLTLGGVLAVGSGGTGLSSTPSNGQILIGNGTGYTKSTITAGSGISISNGSGSITVSLNPSSVLGVANGGTGITAIPTNGQLLIGNGTGYSAATLTAGANVTISNGSGTIVVDAVGGFDGAAVTNISNPSASINPTSGALRVVGGVGIGGNVSVGESVIISGGQPSVISQSTMNITAPTRVEITSSPFRVAQFTTTERDAISAANGDIIYNSTTNKFQGYANGAWVDIS